MVENARASKVKKMSAGRAFPRAKGLPEEREAVRRPVERQWLLEGVGGGTLPCLRELANMGGGFFFGGENGDVERGIRDAGFFGLWLRRPRIVTLPPPWNAPARPTLSSGTLPPRLPHAAHARRSRDCTSFPPSCPTTSPVSLAE